MCDNVAKSGMASFVLRLCRLSFVLPSGLRKADCPPLVTGREVRTKAEDIGLMDLGRGQFDFGLWR